MSEDLTPEVLDVWEREAQAEQTWDTEARILALIAKVREQDKLLVQRHNEMVQQSVDLSEAAERRGALEALLLGMVRQACDADSRADLFPDAHRETEGDGAWDVYWSAHLGYYADAIRHLCRVGKLELLEDDGGRGVWARERADEGEDTER